MKYRPGIWMVTFLTVSLLLANCKKEANVCPESDTFCAYVSEQMFDSTGPIIDQFLGKLNQNTSDEEKLESLRNWLACMSCVDNVEILCVSCIYTNPPQSELKVVFIVDDQEIELILDILMDEKLKFVRFHE
jgi:hypothetical protein